MMIVGILVSSSHPTLAEAVPPNPKTSELPPTHDRNINPQCVAICGRKNNVFWLCSPKGSMDGASTYIWLIYMVNVGRYTIYMDVPFVHTPEV